ncbi:MAG: hypothetical protein RJB13_1924 [Pseudomonadota bacterium]|jgi:sec-independent protein translocase protein TatA
MFGIGGGEILIIAVVAVVLFGTDDLPKNLRKFMKVWNDFRGATTDLQRGWFDVRDKVTRDILNESTNAHPMIESKENKADSQFSEDVGDPSSKVEGLTENTILDAAEQSSIPTPRKADGSVAIGDKLNPADELSDGDTAEGGREKLRTEVSSDSDKSI